MPPRRLVHLTPAQRKRAVTRSLIRFVVIFVGVIGAYYLLPLGGGSGTAEAIARLAAGAVIFVGIMVFEVRRIVKADLPELRAVESLALAVPFFLTTYAAAYVTLSAVSPGSFSQPLNRTGGLYFSIVTFGTVGYGDIAPVTDLARILVSTQVLGDLVFIALVLRIVATASRLTLERRGGRTRNDGADDDQRAG
jgi:voltage-gated potassium channel